MDNIDRPKEVRKGEELDMSRLAPYLAQLNPTWTGDFVVTQFPGGYSNLTYNINIGGQDIILRRPPYGAKIKGGHDMGREYNVQKLLKPHFDKVADVYDHCKDESIIGAEFYLMERVNGMILRSTGLAGDNNAQHYEVIARTWLDTMVELHQVNYVEAGLENLGKPEGYNKRQVEGWTRRYKKAQTSEVKVIEKVMKWLNNSIPDESGHGLIHNDYKYDNVMFETGNWSKLIAILDWEMATIGDPLMDFATSLAYWAEEEDVAVFGELISLPTYQAGNPNRESLIEMYADKSGKDLSNIIYHYVYGLFKIAVIIQQIYYRYHHGLTQDKRFALLGKAAEGFCFKALRAIEKNRISNLF